MEKAAVSLTLSILVGNMVTPPYASSNQDGDGIAC
jgi:hypothetical protein